MLSLALSLGIAALPALAQTSQDWAKLNATVGGRLFPGIPFAQPCFSSFNGKHVTPDAPECTFVEQNSFNSHLNRSQFFGSYDATNYGSCMSTGDQCDLDWSNPTNPLAFEPPADCKQGSVPNFYIDVKNASDVVAALKFSKSTGVRLVVKNTGHDFKGRSAGPGALGLWMHNMKSLSLNSKFIPDGCSLKTAPQSAVTYAAGSQFQEIYQFAHDNNMILIGGSDQSVGATGGWYQGGGHSALSPTLGMGADRALQYQIVTPDGVLRTANACQNSDLFWALRGGGGGTFGVVLEVTVKSSPASTFQVANINWPVSDANLRQVLSVYIDNVTALAKQGWGGYFTVSNMVLLNPNLTTQQGQESMQSLISLTEKLGGVSSVTQVPTFLDWFHEWVGGTAGNIGLPIAMGSRLIPAANHATAQSRAQLLEAMLNAFNSSSFSQVCMTTPFAANQPDAVTSVNPVWRTSLYHVILTNTWEFNATLADKQAAYAASTKAADFLRAITPSSGAYVNEAAVHEPNYQFSFWNSKYERLLQIKNKYDPEHVFDCWQCGKCRYYV
ncbi:FAD-binding domain-containing protein [Gymnopilus junonius]|uniref:FAD-binding domain-containing protein n=1 Tax=Gymnopilus junonius TaxID=109634 RepID=A0A9P5TH03_GYMJU|nr:FAD-binding domain-containing protein [Gymnopilus junonius]